MMVGRWYVQNVVLDTGICHDVSIILLIFLIFFRHSSFQINKLWY